MGEPAAQARASEFESARKLVEMAQGIMQSVLASTAVAGEMSRQASATLALLGDSLPRGDSSTEAARVHAPQSAFAWAPGEKDRAGLLPIRHHDLWAHRKRLEGLRWTAQEVDFMKDKRDWETRMTPGERHFVKCQLGLFSRFDVDVVDNIDANFRDEVDCEEARAYYAAQVDQEWVHTESYALQIEAVLSGEERDEVVAAVRTMPAVGEMRAWMRRWIGRENPLGERLVAWAGVEGVLLSSSFASIQLLRERNLLPGITESNSFITRDEGEHTLTTCLLVRKYLLRRPEPRRVAAIFNSLVALLDEFVETSLPVALIGMNGALMRQYVRFQADCVLAAMDYPAQYRAENPLPFMDKLSLNGVAKTNFFEHRPSQYQTVTRAGEALLALDTTPDDDEKREDDA